MSILNDYDAVIGYRNGMVKGIELKKNKFKYTEIVEKLSVGLNSLTYYGENKIILSYNRAVTIHDLSRKKCLKRHNIIEQGHVIGVFRKNNNLIAGINNGIVSIMPPKYKDYKRLKKIKTEVPISCIREGLKLDNFAIGGTDSPLKIWDLATGQFSFVAKRPKPDMLQLQQPCNVSDIRFFNNNKVIVSHRHGVLDIHDPLSSQRRPVLSLSSEKGFSCLQTMPGHSEHKVIVGTTKGSMFHYDFRGKSKLPVKTYRGSVGSVKAISFIHYSNEIQLMSVSLDCQVRIHNFASGDILMQDYMALRPSALMTKIDVVENL